LTSSSTWHQGFDSSLAHETAKRAQGSGLKCRSARAIGQWGRIARSVEGFEVKEGSTITAATVSPSTSHLAQLALGWHTARIALSEAAELYAGIVVRVVAKLQNCPMCGRCDDRRLMSEFGREFWCNLSFTKQKRRRVGVIRE